jgi:hypothetical protein
VGHRHAFLQGQNLRASKTSPFTAPEIAIQSTSAPSNWLAEHEETGKYITTLEFRSETDIFSS